ncbi:aspartate/glutamate racemase family protein [Marinobacter sp. CHS3-4]|uniref:aspartate/glutamate racemase family protein n=1 Tax=Marinobacter sp. CHS3-4 TaxID=3045174 RepID=UPI0024B512BB|nr:aspartate/glutamate racemase family protein [Marinobacter sp. CHS3-4]MDI9246059.1 aspartate/glutamate racemase family protein [Marinobacter sp. CHS3-4]
MKVIGLLGGMSWESTQTYYRLLNEKVRRQLGGLHSARILLYSVDFAEIAELQKADEWDAAARILSDAARSVEQAGADCLLIGTNTMHKVAPQIAGSIDIPLLHIMDAVGDAILADGRDCVGLLGTRFTMEQAFCVEKLEAKGISVLVPPSDERDQVHAVIFDELCQGVFKESSRTSFLGTVDRLREWGAQGVILGCTEIGLLINDSDTDVALYDTTELHAQSAVDFALGPEKKTI